jgi:acetate kinase
MSDAAPVLVLNAGSATLKYRLFPAGGSGTVEHVGESGGPADHAEAVRQVLDSLPGAHPVAVGHRVVHGGELRTPVVVDDKILSTIDGLSRLAPAHNPAAVAGIRAAREAYPDAPHVAVFDTAFHATIPAEASTYAIDREVAAAHDIRRYGFHGISVRWVRDRAAELLGRPVTALNMVVLHLGNGASATAVRAGESVDTSMGMTPSQGLVMGTRSGDLDPAITFHLLRAGWNPDDIEQLYGKRSGLYGLSGDNDVRDVQRRARSGDRVAGAALDVYCHRIRSYVGAYHAVLGRLDAIVFTGGVGEHSAEVRVRSLAGLEPMGIELDASGNASAAGPTVVSRPGSRVAICVVPTDEERAIAGEVATLLNLPGY